MLVIAAENFETVFCRSHSLSSVHRRPILGPIFGMLSCASTGCLERSENDPVSAFICSRL